MNEAMKNAMLAKLKQTGIGYEDIKVFGAIRCNVHVVCVSRATAGKWAHLLATVFKGAQVSTTPTVWYAKKNRGTCLSPTVRKGFLIAVAA